MSRNVELALLFFGFVYSVSGFVLDESNSEGHSVFSYIENDIVTASSPSSSQTLMVNLTLIEAAASKGAVCLDGTLPGYHLDPGFGSGANGWLIELEGGGWCNNIKTCAYRKTTRRGSSNYMEKQILFKGILSNKAEENPGLTFSTGTGSKYGIVMGASFSGDSQNEAAQLQFRGQRIWLAAMEELMSKGMQNADHALLSGCSAGGLATIIHCDEFKSLFPNSTQVKCLSDAGFFLDADDVSGGRTMRNLFAGVVQLQEVKENLPESCLSQFDPTSCFFPQNLVNHVETPLFLLNAAYDSWQVQASLIPAKADPYGSWNDCKSNHANCNSSQIQFLQDFRTQMLNALQDFSSEAQAGMFINSCFSHCQSEKQELWFSDNSPLLMGKPVAIAVGDWYFDRDSFKVIDCAYPCDNTCHNLVFN